MYPLFRREVFSLVIVQLFAIFTLNTFGTYVGIQLDRLDALAVTIGLVFATRNLVQIFLRVPFSEMSQIVGRKPMIQLGVLFYSLALGLLYLANSWVWVLISSIFVGIAMSMHWPAIFSYLGDISGKQYGKFSGILFQGQDIGIIISSFTATYLLSNGIVELKGLFGLTFIIGIIGFILSFFILGEVLDEKERKHVDSIKIALKDSFTNTINSLVKLTRSYPLGVVFLLELIVTFTEFFMTSFFPLLVVITLGYEDGDVAKIVMITTIILLLFKPYLGIIFDRFGYKWPILLALIITAAVFSYLPRVNSIIELIACFAIINSSFYIMYIATSGGVNNNSPPKQRALSMGVLGVYISAGRSMSSVVLAPVLGFFEDAGMTRADGLASLFQFTSVLVIVMVIIMIGLTHLLKKKYDKQVEA